MSGVGFEVDGRQIPYVVAGSGGFSATRPCEGVGRCVGMGCAVFLRSPADSVSPATWREKIFHRMAYKNGKRLACQCVAKRDLTVVTIP